MPESTVCEIKLVPSITVDVHPTIEVVPVKQVDLTQEEVEKAIGLKITGGADFQMPITIFHASFFCFFFIHGFNVHSKVKDDSKAQHVGLKLGDSIVAIEGKDTKDMTLKEANEALLHASHNIRSFKLSVIQYGNDF